MIGAPRWFYRSQTLGMLIELDLNSWSSSSGNQELSVGNVENVGGAVVIGIGAGERQAIFGPRSTPGG